MPFTAWKHTERNRKRDRKVCYVFIRSRDSCSTDNSLNDSTKHSLEPTKILFKRPYKGQKKSLHSACMHNEDTY